MGHENNMSSSRLQLPGFGKPLSFRPGPNDKFFMHALWAENRFESVGLTLREVRMMEFINHITDKPKWERKVFDEEIVSKWRKEAGVDDLLPPPEMNKKYAAASGDSGDREEDGDSDGGDKMSLDEDGAGGEGRAKSTQKVDNGYDNEEEKEGGEGEDESEFNLDGDVCMSEKMFDYCIKELRDKAADFENSKIVSIFDAEIEVAKSDSIVPESLSACLKTAVRPLEDVPDHQKDWHPGSDGKVLDLVHPSLFPMVYGRSRVLPRDKVPLYGCEEYIGSGDTYALPNQSPDRDIFALGTTQWLPSDVVWTSSGGARIASYVNNLHPDDHAELYGVLEQFVVSAVPLWERCLYTSPSKDPAEDGDEMQPRESRFSLHSQGYEEDFYLPEGVEYVPPARAKEENWDEYDIEDDRFEWRRQYHILKWPEPNDYDPSRPRPAEARPNLRSMFPDGLQVIFKLANIHLSPSNPKYDGGSLHIEGALNDRIVATALHYYDCDNITESVLSLKQPVDSIKVIRLPPQDEFEAVERWLGLPNESASLQHLGRIVTREGRFIAFPNVLAHRVEPFKLADATKPGHRKILAMFLVDPHIRVLSTSVVPPQRKDWWARSVQDIAPFSNLPREIFDLIIEFVDGFPMSWDDAIAIRQTLMEERSQANYAWKQERREFPFNFCEH